MKIESVLMQTTWHNLQNKQHMICNQPNLSVILYSSVENLIFAYR